MESRECSICLSDFDVSELNNKLNLPYRLPCGHLFHKSCIEEWFENFKLCPVCNESYNKIDIRYDPIVTDLLTSINSRDSKVEQINHQTKQIFKMKKLAISVVAGCAAVATSVILAVPLSFATLGTISDILSSDIRIVMQWENAIIGCVVITILSIGAGVIIGFSIYSLLNKIFIKRSRDKNREL